MAGLSALLRFIFKLFQVFRKGGCETNTEAGAMGKVRSGPRRPGSSALVPLPGAVHSRWWMPLFLMVKILRSHTTRAVGWSVAWN